MMAHTHTMETAMTKASILPTANPDWGLFGTIRHDVDPAEAWAIAMPAIAAATGCPNAAVGHATIASRSLNADRRLRDVFGSRQGRHLADDVANGLAAGLNLRAAVEAAVERWMGWRIGRRTECETGIPRGLPYPTGFVTHCEIEADAGA